PAYAGGSLKRQSFIKLVPLRVSTGRHRTCVIHHSTLMNGSRGNHRVSLRLIVTVLNSVSEGGDGKGSRQGAESSRWTFRGTAPIQPGAFRRHPLPGKRSSQADGRRAGATGRRRGDPGLHEPQQFARADPGGDWRTSVRRSAVSLGDGVRRAIAS